MRVLEILVHVRIVASGSERVLRQIVRADGEKIDMPCDRRYPQGGGRRLDHGTERRTFLGAESGTCLVEQPARRTNVLLERDHRNQYADILRLRQTDERAELCPQQQWMLEQQAHAADTEGWVRFQRRPQEGQRLVTADVE